MAKRKQNNGRPNREKRPTTLNAALMAEVDIEVIEAAEGDSPKQPTVAINAYNGGLLRVAGFYEPVVIDLKGLRAGNVTLLKDHDRSQIVGQGVAKIMTSKVKVTGKVTGDWLDVTTPAGQVLAHSANGFKWPVSVGVTVDAVKYVEAGEKITVNGKTFKGPIAVATAGRLGETSFVGVGADETADATIAAEAADFSGEQTMKTFNEWLLAAGFDPEDITDEQRVTLQASYDAEQTIEAEAGDGEGGEGGGKEIEAEAVDGADDPAKEYRSSVVIERKRIADIEAIDGAGDHPKIVAKAIEDGDSVVKAEVAILRAARPEAPSIHASQPHDNEAQVVEAGLMMGSQLNVDKMFDDKVLEAANKRYGSSGLGLGEMILNAAEQTTGRRMSYKRDGMKDILAAGFSNNGLTGVLSNTANKFLLDGYMYGDNSDLAITGKRSVSDFKQVTSYRMTADSQFQEVGPGGQLHHFTQSEDAYTNQAKTYGIMHAVTRTDIINDDLGVFDQMRRHIGMGAAHKRRNVVWTAFMDNATFFASGNGNYQSGADTVLSMDSMTAALQLFMDQTDDNGQPIGIDPAMLLVPTALAGSAMSLFDSMEIRDTTASTTTLTANIHKGKFSPVVSRYLGNSSYTGSSDTAWYLLANPAELATIELCYLNGIETPTIETADADFSTLGIQFRGYFDFGVAMQDPKGGVKSAGA